MELNVFTWFLRKTNITWIFQKLNFSTNYYGIEYMALQIMLAWWIMLVILVGFWQIIPRVVTVFPVLQWLTEDTIQHHLLMIVEKVSVWRQICVIQNIENYGVFTSIFIILYKDPYHFSLDILNSYIRNWLLCCTLLQREPLIILSHCLFHSELEFVFWYSQGFGMCFEITEMVTWPEGLTQFTILQNDE